MWGSGGFWLGLGSQGWCSSARQHCNLPILMSSLAQLPAITCAFAKDTRLLQCHRPFAKPPFRP
eukprot:3967758-Amphidinium_carterae.1